MSAALYGFKKPFACRAQHRSRCVVINAQKPHSAVPVTDGRQGFAQRRALIQTAAGLLLSLPLHASQAQAGVVGEAIAGMWRSRQLANRDLILAPIKVAQLRLAEAVQMMDGVMANDPSGQGLTPVLHAVRVSSLNCYAFEALPDDSLETKASLASQALQFSDPCTFRLIVKNITGLSPDETRRQGEDLVAQLILSYQKLDGELEGAIQGSRDSGAAARSQLQTTVGYINKLETFVAGILA